MHKPIIIIILISLFYFSCNKNSLELPPTRNNLILRDTTCFYNGTAIALIHFKQDTVTNKEGKVDIEITNLTGEGVNSCKIYIEMCDDKPSYINCSNQYVFKIDQLLSDKKETKTLPFKNIRLDKVIINAGIISTEKKFTILSNVYDGEFAKYIDISNTSLEFKGSAKGVVFADGQSILRLSLDNNTYYNITGKFIDTTDFINGHFYKFDTPEKFSASILQTSDKKTGFFYNPDKNLVKFGFAIDTPQSILGTSNKIDSVILNLTKQQQ